MQLFWYRFYSSFKDLQEVCSFTFHSVVHYRRHYNMVTGQTPYLLNAAPTMFPASTFVRLINSSSKPPFDDESYLTPSVVVFNPKNEYYSISLFSSQCSLSYRMSSSSSIEEESGLIEKKRPKRKAIGECTERTVRRRISALEEKFYDAVGNALEVVYFNWNRRGIRINWIMARKASLYRKKDHFTTGLQYDRD